MSDLTKEELRDLKKKFDFIKESGKMRGESKQKIHERLSIQRAMVVSDLKKKANL